jgi:hypothetical protein
VRLFPQAPFLPGFGEPEVVWLSPAAGTVRPGPADDRIYVIDPVEKPEPYEFPYLPPFLGFANPPVTGAPRRQTQTPSVAHGLAAHRCSHDQLAAVAPGTTAGIGSLCVRAQQFAGSGPGLADAPAEAT